MKPISFSVAVNMTAAEETEGKRPTFAIDAYTGVAMRAGGAFSQPVVVDLSGVKAAKAIPVLLDHDAAQIVGQGEPQIDASGIRIAGTVTGDDGPAARVVTHAKNGFQWQASIGGNVGKHEYLKAGETATVNARQVTGPAVIAREFHLREVSFVALGADAATSAAVAASQTERKENMNDFEKWLQAKGFDPATLQDGARDYLKASFDAENKPVEKRVESKPGDFSSMNEVFAAAKAERQRQEEIARICADALRENPHMAEELEIEAKRAVETKMGPNQFELQVLRASRPKSAAVATRRQEVTSQVLECALAQAMKLGDVEKHYDERTLQAADNLYHERIGLQQMLLIAAREQGCEEVSLRSNASIRNVLRAAFSDPKPVRASGFSTINTPYILSNVANKFVREAFGFVENAWRDITAVRNVSDFKQISTHSLTGDLTYEKLGAGGEIKHGELGEQRYTNKADTYAKMLAITRQDIINDDLGAFQAVPRRLGRGAALKINEVFWTEFMDNSTFFTVGRGNYDEGTDTALTAAGLDAALVFWNALTDPDGKPMGHTPRILLVPPGQWYAAQALMTSTNFNNGTTSNQPERNVFAGMFRVVMSRYLANSSFTGNSSTAYYLLADPMDVPVIETAFLGGREEPVVETAEADFNALGIQMRGYHDFGVNLQEYRGGCKFKGAA